MIEAVKYWNEPNNLSHWDFQMDPGWKKYSEITSLAAEAINSIAPNLTRVLAGISPIDPYFIQMLKDRVHGIQDSSSLYSGRKTDDMVLPDSPRES